MNSIRNSILVLVIAGAACGESEPSDPAPVVGTAPTEPTSTPAPTPTPPPAPNALTLGGPPVTLNVPGLPGFTITVATAGEYQIDAMGSPLDAQIMLFKDGQSVGSDSDSGEGTDARLITFLDPGTYQLRVGEWGVREMNARVQVTQMSPMTPAATIATNGTEVVVNAPAGDFARAASVELALTVPTAGSYRLTAVDPSGQFDPEMQLTQNGGLLQADSDSGGNRAAQIVRQLSPGEYRIRVRDWQNRATPITVAVAPQ